MRDRYSEVHDRTNPTSSGSGKAALAAWLPYDAATLGPFAIVVKAPLLLAVMLLPDTVTPACVPLSLEELGEVVPPSVIEYCLSSG